jgi:hypothetical protein
VKDVPAAGVATEIVVVADAAVQVVVPAAVREVTVVATPAVAADVEDGRTARHFLGRAAAMRPFFI